MSMKAKIHQVPFGIAGLGGLPLVFLGWIDKMPGHATVMVVDRGNPLEAFFQGVFPDPPYVIVKDRQCLETFLAHCKMHDFAADT